MEKIDLRKLPPAAVTELRKQVIRQKEAKMSNLAVSELTGICKDTVYRIWREYKKDGTSSFIQKKRGRKPYGHSKLTKEQQAEVRKTIIDKTPDQVKLSFCLWTRQAINDYIRQRYGVKLTLRSISTYMKKWGLTCQRPTKRAYSQDNVKIRQFMEKDYPRIAKRAKAEHAVIYWGDEVGISNQENYQRGFAPKGTPPVMNYETKRERLNMFSAITNQGSVRFMIFEDSMNQNKLIEFMRRMINDTTHKVYLILDNLKVHHGKKVSAWVDRHKDRIELFFLPPYAPEYNPDEYLNNALKHDVHSGFKPRTKSEIKSKTQSFMRRLQHNPVSIMKFFKHKKLQYINRCI